MPRDEFMRYSECIRQQGRLNPHHIALVVDAPSGRTDYSFGAFDKSTDVVASVLAANGVTSRSAVIVQSPNCAEGVISASAAWRLGAFVVPVSDRASRRDVESAIANAREVKDHVCLISDAFENCGANISLGLSGILSAGESGDVEEAEANPARAVPSGGTTGRPKLIVHPARWGIDPSARSILDDIGWTTARSVMVFSPLYHSAGQTLTFKALMAGKTAVVMDRFDAARAVAIIESAGIEFFFAVPTHMQRMLQLPNVDAAAFRSVKSMYHSGAACPQSVKRAWISLLGAERVWELFGATDGNGFTMVRGDEWLQHPGTVGRPHGCEVRILDDGGKRLAAGEVGLIYMRPLGAVDQPAPYYLGVGAIERTADGFTTVGDLGWLDDDGYLYVSDRRTDMIISGGVNIFPAEVEAALVAHPKVAGAAVVGLPDPQWGKRVHALIVPKSADAAPSAEELDAFLGEELLPYKRPKSYEFRSVLPYTEVGKIDRRAIIEALGDQA